jgi:N6-L-threonylcarbamoyladenine synthase
MKILGIETSCDETAVAIVDDEKNILSHVINSQIELHKKYGGVIPELAARGHIEVLDELILQALQQANLKLEEIDGFAATSGPGLIGGVIVGMMAAKTLASVHKKPFIAVNHLEGHALTVRLATKPFPEPVEGCLGSEFKHASTGSATVNFPYLLLLVSGGHCKILLAQGVGSYKKLGETIDDALGEAFDKIAQMLDLPYPGGPQVEKLAKSGNENRFNFPRPLLDSKDQNHLCNFSFSGLKTAVRREIEKLTGEEFSHFTTPKKVNEKDRVDICASFQRVVCEIIINRLENVLKKEKTKTLVIAGGVAANFHIFSHLENWAAQHEIKVTAPPIHLCTDNAAMVAWVGVEKLALGKIDELNFKPRARWDL